MCTRSYLRQHSNILRKAKFRLLQVQKQSNSFVAFVLLLLCSQVSLATTQLDRLYRMGEEDLSQSGPVSDTFDGIFLDGVSFVDAQDLTVGSSSPTYTSLGGSGINDPLPGGVSSSTAITFDGDDFLTGSDLGDPATTVSNIDANSPILGNYDGLAGRGFQFWARPSDQGGGSPASGSTQTLISDGERHAVIIDGAGNWRARYNDTFVTSAIQASADAWTHLMLVSPTGTSGATFYVDGIAAVGFGGSYTGGTNELFIGSRSDTSEFYSGVIDEVEMFVLGDNGTVSADFNYATDNDYFTEVFLPSQSGYNANDAWITGDTDFDGDVDTDDVNAFIANWLSTSPVTGAASQAGDYTSIMLGDLDVDGDVDREDFFLLREANPAAVAAVFGIAVPEPSSLMLLLGGLGLAGGVRLRRNSIKTAKVMTKRSLAVALPLFVLCLLSHPVSAQITWDAGGDGVSIFEEANWTADGDIAGTDPAADTVNPNTAINFDMVVGNVGGMGATVGGSDGGGTMLIGDGFSLTVQQDATYRSSISSGASIGGVLGTMTETLSILDTAEVITQFLSNLDVSMSGSSELFLNGSGDPIGGTTTIDFASDWTGSVTFAGESINNVISEHLPSLTVNGAPAVYGTNVDLVSNGSGGSILSLGTSPSSPMLTIDRDTGNMLLENGTGSSLGEIVQYDIQSASGGFQTANWDSIADTGGAEGDGTPIGATGWFELTGAGAVSSDLSEGTFGAGVNFVDSLSLDLGDGSWISSPFEDVQMVLQDASGNDIEVVVVYTGSSVAEGDFNGDGIIDELDWPTVRDNLLTDVSGLSPINQYLSGDLTGDGLVNRLDFNEFKTLFEAQPGAGSFESMISAAAVPEPSAMTLSLLLIAGALIVHRRGRISQQDSLTLATQKITNSGSQSMVNLKNYGLHTTTFVAVIMVGSNSFAQLITWDAGGDGVSTFAEANWTAVDGIAGTDPPADFVNPQTDILANMLVGGSGTAGGPAGAGGHVDLGTGLSLTVQDDASFNVRVNNGSSNRGIRGVSAGVDTESLFINDNGSVTSQFLLDISAFLTDASTLTLGGGGVGTLNNSTVDLAADWTGSITWLNFDITGSTIFDNIFIDGSPAVPGSNVQFTVDGSQSVLTIDDGSIDPGLLSLVVDPVTGYTRIDGADVNVDIDYYEISSAASQLNTGDWQSLQDQGIDGNTAVDGFGWEEAGGSNPAVVAEAFLTGPGGSDSTVAASSTYAFLGELFDGGATVTEDLQFFYQVDGALVQGNVIADTVTPPVGIDGDYNNDGMVDAADYTVWRDNLGTSAVLPNDTTPGSVDAGDYTVWVNNFGQSSSASSASAVPEPTTIALVVFGCLMISPYGTNRNRR